MLRRVDVTCTFTCKPLVTDEPLVGDLLPLVGEPVGDLLDGEPFVRGPPGDLLAGESLAGEPLAGEPVSNLKVLDFCLACPAVFVSSLTVLIFLS
jgi:hypothetical protein